MSSLAPLMGRLSQVFSARLCLFYSTFVICAGSTITAMSTTFAMFICGRVVTGVGAAGVMVVASIIVIQMASAKKRGLYLGLINSGVTTGVSLGAVIAGALEPKIGWVSAPLMYTRTCLTFAAETPVRYPSATQPSGWLWSFRRYSCRLRGK